MKPSLFPLALKLEGRRVLVVGAGSIASSKIESLLETGARVRVVAPDNTILPSSTAVEYHPRIFRPSDLDGCWLAVAAATPEVNRDVARHAAKRRVFLVAVDDPSNCSAYTAAVVRREGVTFGISTDGAAPALAGLFREALQELLPADVEDWLRTAVALREKWRRERTRMNERRPLLLRALNHLYETRRFPTSGQGAP